MGNLAVIVQNGFGFDAERDFLRRSEVVVDGGGFAACHFVFIVGDGGNRRREKAGLLRVAEGDDAHLLRHLDLMLVECAQYAGRRAAGDDEESREVQPEPLQMSGHCLVGFLRGIVPVLRVTGDGDRVAAAEGDGVEEVLIEHQGASARGLRQEYAEPGMVVPPEECQRHLSGIGGVEIEAVQRDPPEIAVAHDDVRFVPDQQDELFVGKFPGGAGQHDEVRRAGFDLCKQIVLIPVGEGGELIVAQLFEGCFQKLDLPSDMRSCKH